jgi:hypothetical protein
LGAGLEGWNRGQQARDAMLQRRALAEQQARQQAEAKQQEQAQLRKQAFEQNARGLLSSYGEYAYTPEGRKGLVNDLTKAGFGPEAMGLFGQMDGMMPEKPKAQEYQFKEFGDQAVTFNPATGKAEAIPGMKKTDTPKPKQYKPVKNKAGKVVGWDPETGLGMDGKPVEFWQEPKAAKTDGLKPEQVFTQEQQLANQFQTKTKDFRDVRDAYGRIQVSAKDPSAAGDLALIFNYMKMLDPGSTVREGEFANAQNAAGIPERIVNSYNKALSGERLAPTQRADFTGRAKGLYNQALRQYEKTKFETRKRASMYPGLNPDRILLDDGLAEEAPGGGGMPTHEQYDSLPSGAEFTDPQGNIRRKP